jgi:hypothetical protein
VSYFICVVANSSTIRAIYDNVVSPAGVQVQDQDASTFGPPMAFSFFGHSLNDDRSSIAYMTYTAAGGGGGGAPRFVGFQMMMRNN